MKSCSDALSVLTIADIVTPLDGKALPDCRSIPNKEIHHRLLRSRAISCELSQKGSMYKKGCFHALDLNY